MEEIEQIYQESKIQRLRTRFLSNTFFNNREFIAFITLVIISVLYWGRDGFMIDGTIQTTVGGAFFGLVFVIMSPIWILLYIPHCLIVYLKKSQYF